MTGRQPAHDPSRSAVVMASAGSGKTWTLVSRIVRLLLNGVPLNQILAITFTVKAAAEMRERTQERLRAMSVASEAELRQQLELLGHPVNSATLRRAPILYETVLQSAAPLRIMTFHALFQELLSQFPLEAGVAPGFVLSENTTDQQALAWDELLTEIDQQRQGPLADQFSLLLRQLGNYTTEQALNAFLSIRSDWWAWTENQPDAVDFAVARLRETMGIGQSPPVEIHSLLDASLQRYIADFQHQAFPAKARERARDAAALLATRAANTREQQATILALHDLLHTKAKSGFTPYARSKNKQLIEQFGDDGLEAISDNYYAICAELHALRERIIERRNFELVCAWYQVGARYLEIFQQVKQRRRELDFADLEWRACQLLNRQDEFGDVLRKLDDSIEHLLIDEFQDTNPTQWRFVLALLGDYAAREDYRNNVFIVGDTKQSIYRFRRADPELLPTAADWMQSRLEAAIHRENTSWRSAPAIIQAVNQLFCDEQLAAQIGDFEAHDTHRGSLRGRVEILPTFHPPEIQPPSESELRNPLDTPRETPLSGFDLEAQAIAARIEQLYDTNVAVTSESGGQRALEFRDIKILVRKRTHVESIERELQLRGIPFLGTSRGTYMDRPEIADLCALLRLLSAPGDDLALARVLRSPLFDCDEEDLLTLADINQGDWSDRLAACAEADLGSDKLRSAYAYISRWSLSAKSLPLHDLMTEIFHSADVVNRYVAAFPVWQHAQLRANLHHFTELTLEHNAGRYPGIHQFLQSLDQRAKAQGEQSLSEPLPDANENAVEILTVHQAKGLESTVLFLAHAHPGKDQARSNESLVDWPANAARPNLIVFLPTKSERSRVLNSFDDQQELKQQREAANLLYVAATRARQLLIISGSAGRRSNNATRATENLDRIREILEPIGRYDEDGRLIIGDDLESADRPQAITVEDFAHEPDPDLRARLHSATSDPEIAPSRSEVHEICPDGRALGKEKGLAVHHALYRLSIAPRTDDTAIRREIAAMLSMEVASEALDAWMGEAHSTIRNFPALFEPDGVERAYAELPVSANHGAKRLFGIIDRVLVYSDRIELVDFKSHEFTGNAAAFAAQFSAQLKLYQIAGEKIWPGRATRCGLLFTAKQEMVWLD